MRNVCLHLASSLLFIFPLYRAMSHSCISVTEMVYDHASQMCYVNEMCIEEDTPLVDYQHPASNPAMETGRCLRMRHCLLA